MPPKKRLATDSDIAARSEKPASNAPRQRVSLACDSCRTAREKCDGGRPHCGTCLAQSRACSYTPAYKKRGVQTGYLRTIELALALALEKYPDGEEELFRILTKDDGGEGAGVLLTGNLAGNRLHKRWIKSRVHKEIERLLSDGQTSKNEPCQDDSSTDVDIMEDSPNKSTHRSTTDGPWYPEWRNQASSGSTTSPRNTLQLPSNHKRLIDIYFSYTHCWLPIVSREEALATAACYDPYGVSSQSAARVIKRSQNAELWAILSVASFQDAGSLDPSSPSRMNPVDVLSVARSFVTDDEGDFDSSTVRALLLHALILLGRGSELAAGLLVGKATRILLHIRHGKVSDGATELSLRTLLHACFLLDIISSAALKQSPPMLGLSEDLLMMDICTETPEVAELWTPLPGFGQLQHNMDSGNASQADSLLTLTQLSRFALLLSKHAQTGLSRDSSQSLVSAKDLVACLDPHFAFCNSVISGGLIPTLPSAYLVKAMFLATTAQLVPGYQGSLLSTLLEVVETSISKFGACGTSPIIVPLLSLARYREAIDVRGFEASTWASAVEMIKTVWSGSSTMISGNRASPLQDLEGRLQGTSAGGAETFSHNHLVQSQPTASQRPRAQTITQLSELPAANMSRPTSYQVQNLTQLPSAIGLSWNPELSFQPTSTHSRPADEALQISDQLNYPVDYDAIFDELGTIDYTENIDLDPQFMVNLGFAPGCDLDEMFQNDYGS